MQSSDAVVYSSFGLNQAAVTSPDPLNWESGNETWPPASWACRTGRIQQRLIQTTVYAIGVGNFSANDSTSRCRPYLNASLT